MVKLLPLSTPKVSVFEGRELLSHLRNQFLSCYTLCSEFVLFQPKILYSFEGFLLLQEAKFLSLRDHKKILLFTCLSFTVMSASKEQILAATPHPLQLKTCCLSASSLFLWLRVGEGKGLQ